MSSFITTLVGGFDWAVKGITWAVRIFIFITFLNTIPFTFSMAPEIFNFLTSTFFIDLLKSMSFFFPIKFILGCIGIVLTIKYYKIIYSMFISIYSLIFKD